jgi:hypothetical protein
MKPNKIQFIHYYRLCDAIKTVIPANAGIYKTVSNLFSIFTRIQLSSNIQAFIIMTILSGILLSCSSNKSDDLSQAVDKICIELKKSLTPQTLKKSGDIFKAEYLDKQNIQSGDLAERYAAFRPCFGSLNYKIPVLPENPNSIITGDMNQYFTIATPPMELILEGDAIPAFNLHFTFSVTKKLSDTINLELNGNLHLLDENSNIVKSYNLYPTPDFYRFLKIGKGDFKYTAFLSPMWNPFDDNPFAKSAETLTQMLKVKKYRLEITSNKSIKTKSAQEKTDQQDGEILDKLLIK